MLAIEGVLCAKNKCKTKDKLFIESVQELRPDAPILVSEYWPGWFDHWFEDVHNTLSDKDFR